MGLFFPYFCGEQHREFVEEKQTFMTMADVPIFPQATCFALERKTGQIILNCETPFLLQYFPEYTNCANIEIYMLW